MNSTVANSSLHWLALLSAFAVFSAVSIEASSQVVSVGQASVEPVSVEPVVPAAVSTGDAKAWLVEMANSFSGLDYDGVLVSNRGGKMRSVRVIHIVRNGQEHERLQYLDGEAVEVERKDHPVDCIHAGSQLVLNDTKLFGNYAEQSGLNLNGIYRLEVQADSRVAGRPVSVLMVIPNDTHRYAHSLYLDQSSRLLLKSQVLDRQSKVLESFQFTQIKLGDDVDPEAVELISDNAVKESFHALPVHPSLENTDVNWRLAWTPAGFIQSSHLEHPKLAMAVEVQSQHFTDGFAVFSVFVEPREEAVEAFETRDGSTLAYVMPRKLNQQWVAVTVVGEVPLATAVQIAQSLEEKPVQTALLKANREVMEPVDHPVVQQTLDAAHD